MPRQLSRRSVGKTLLAGGAFLASGPGAAAQATPTAGSLPGDVQALLDSHAGQGDVPGILLFVSAPDAGIEWLGASGVIDTSSGNPLPANATFRIASNTKTYTAAAILRLVEQGKLDLAGTLDTLLPEEMLTALTDGGYAPAEITVEMLAHHTSGLWDYASSQEYIAAILDDPGHRWSRLEQLEFAMANGQPVGPPGNQFAYGDTGYILLGDIIERVSGQDLAGAYRTLLPFATLGLDATWLESMEPAPPGAGPMAHAYLGPTDTSGFDPSFDLYGGGGLVASISDLGRFYQALFANEVFDQPETLDRMLRPPPDPSLAGIGMGIFGSEFEGATAWGHAGTWGSTANVVPDRNLTFALMTNQSAPGNDAKLGDFSEDLFELIMAALEE